MRSVHAHQNSPPHFHPHDRFITVLSGLGALRSIGATERAAFAAKLPRRELVKSFDSVPGCYRYLRKKGQNRQANCASSLGHAKRSNRKPEMETQSFKANVSAISLSTRSNIRPAATTVIKVLAPETAKPHLVKVHDDCVRTRYQLEPVRQTPVAEIANFARSKGGTKAAYLLVKFFSQRQVIRSKKS